MLQQTTVGAVRPRYGEFLSRFPDVAALARARPESVLAAWSGLGYYARARNLHAAARTVVRDHAGRLPRDPADLRALPGFGEYMAAAVASLAFGARTPAVDANVARVLSRLFAIEGVVGSRAHTERVRLSAAALLAPARPGDVTAALMDLGQLICTPRNPRCAACPLSPDCAALARGEVERFPRKKPRPKTARVFVAAAAARDGGRLLLVRSSHDLLRGLWLFPAAQGDTPARAFAGLRAAAPALGLRIDRAEPARQDAPHDRPSPPRDRRLPRVADPAFPAARGSCAMAHTRAARRRRDPDADAAHRGRRGLPAAGAPACARAALRRRRRRRSAILFRL